MRRLMESAGSPRIDPLPPEEWDEVLQRVVDGMPGGREQPLNIFTTIARHPDLFNSWVRFGGQLLFGGTLPARERELAILRTAKNSDSAYEWAQHVRLGKASGLEDAEIEAVGQSLDKYEWSDADRLLLEAVDELDSTSSLSDETWAALSERYDQKQMIEFPMLVGHYKMVACVLNSLRVQVEPYA